MPSGGMTPRTSCTRRCGVQSVLGGAGGNPAQDAVAERQQRLRVRDLAFDAVSQEPQRGTKIADDLGLREVDLFDMRRLVADMDDVRPVPAHDERRLLDRIVADRDDEVRALDGLVNVVALGERGGAHVEFGAAGHGALAHLRREIWNTRPQHELCEV